VTDGARVGFQGSETSSVAATVYHRGGDPIISLLSGPGAVEFRGRSERSEEGTILSCDTSKSLGSSAGSFALTVKPSTSALVPDLRELLIDDDWVDITLFRHGRPFHTLRGLVEAVELDESTVGKGATSRTFTLSGRDHGAVFDKTKLWFNQVAGEIAAWSALQIQEGNKAIGAPDQLVEKLLFDFLGAQEDASRANWVLPTNMPGAQTTFPQTVVFANTFDRQDPFRTTVSAQFMQPDGEGIWQLAQEYSDPLFTELFTDLAADTAGTQFVADEESSPGESELAVFFREKPFVTVAKGTQSAWYQLPLLEVPKQHIGSKRVATSTSDRYNAYFVHPQYYQETGLTRELAFPLWDEEDILIHGLRPFNVESRYSTSEADIIGMATTLRERVRDWHCLGPYFGSGTIKLNRFYPDARIGTRLRIPNESEELQEDYYIESVDQTWRQKAGGRTTLGVTRGWRGGDANYRLTLGEIAARYKQGRKP
jgi:hypothetical protein